MVNFVVSLKRGALFTRGALAHGTYEEHQPNAVELQVSTRVQEPTKRASRFGEKTCFAFTEPQQTTRN